MVLPAVLVVLQAHVAAAAADDQTRSLLIEKLSQVYLNLAPADSSKVAITLRLADLHAERARVDAMRELENGCVQCTAGKADRTKALSYYNEVLDRVPDSSIGKVMAQIGHLYELTGQERQAIEMYERILKNPKTPEAASEANLSLAEVMFKRRDFARASSFYQAVLAGPPSPSRGLAAYRLAWCDFNLGRLEPAISRLQTILKTPELLSRGGAAGVVQIDRQFQEEVSRDLATFFARRNVTVADAQAVFDLSPDNAKIANVTYLANEVERLGQKAQAIEMWRFALAQQSRPEARLEGHIRLAQLQVDRKQIPAALKDYDAALALWPQLEAGCQSAASDQCREMRSRLRNILVDWHKTQQKNPTAELLETYRKFTAVFPQDLEAVAWSAQVARELKQFAWSVELFTEVAQKAKASGDTATRAKVEASLLSAIESAELAKDNALEMKAYDGYLALSTEKSKELDVSYQRARSLYEQGDYVKAADALRAVAKLEAKGDQTLKKKAADLSLDALVLAKRELEIATWAKEYQKAFPKAATDFAEVERRTILTRATDLASPKQGEAQPQAAWDLLATFDASGASSQEKLAFHKNRLILAEKLGKFSEARIAAEQLLRTPGLSKEDRTYALTRKSWLSELTLDFDGALKALDQALGTAADETQLLRLAMFAELAGQSPNPFYSRFLNVSKDASKRASVAAILVRDAKDPMKEFDRQRAALASQPAVLAELTLELYGKSGLPAVRKVASMKDVMATEPGRLLARLVLLDQVAASDARVKGHQLDTKTQRTLAQSLKARFRLLEELEKTAQTAVEAGDWTAQLVALSSVARENSRFYQEVMTLPVPAGLSPEEEQQYLGLLAQQAAPHQTKAQDVQKKVDEFWANEAALQKLTESYRTAVSGRRAAIATELAAAESVAPEAAKVRLASARTSTLPTEARPAVEMVEKARTAVRNEPMSASLLGELMKLEKELGRATMATYLEGRIESLKK
jgi:tetratricopeptide (TPR) repeat protein